VKPFSCIQLNGGVVCVPEWTKFDAMRGSKGLPTSSRFLVRKSVDEFSTAVLSLRH
jgi:hypothetical protein